MKEINTVVDEFDDFPENAKFVVTPEFLLYQTISEYGIDLGPWTAKIWEHIFEDFMKGLEKQGVVEKKSDGEE